MSSRPEGMTEEQWLWPWHEMGWLRDNSRAGFRRGCAWCRLPATAISQAERCPMKFDPHKALGALLIPKLGPSNTLGGQIDRWNARRAKEGKLPGRYDRSLPYEPPEIRAVFDRLHDRLNGLQVTINRRFDMLLQQTVSEDGG